MSLFPALVPQGTLLYHGGCAATVPNHTEWLAFEVPHAELFASGWCMTDGDALQPQWKEALGQDDGGHGKPRPSIPGWLQTYQTNRPLRLLYIDGMAAAKSDFGPLDTQDYLLSGNFARVPFDEWNRAHSLCQLATEWRLDGFIRMEAGFEIIKCNFSDGLDQLSARRRPPRDSPAATGLNMLLEYIRDVSARYNGIDASRVILDYSSMISAYFYPVNLTNPDPISNIPRLLSSTPAELSHIRSDLAALITKSHLHTSIDWQGVVDMISKRYSNRLQHMATDPPTFSFLATINELLNIYIDYDDLDHDSINACSEHYLLSVQPTTLQDRLIYTAIETVTRHICQTLFSVRDKLFEVQPEPQEQVSDDLTPSPAELIQSLISWLDWPDWKSCGTCALDEVCFVAVFPFGSAKDHYNPSCKNRTGLDMRDSSYWTPGRRN